MNNKEIINLLQRKILDVLPSIIGKGRTILTDLPYHGNIGDILIWEGELLFLKYINAFPLSQTSSSTFMFPELDEDITICLHGGGNFGDLYRGAQEFRKKVLISYPKNRIVILPQSVWYDNKDLIEDDARLFAKHPNLYICARDNTSYEFLKHFFKANNVFLVPDMAFCIGDISDRNKATANMTKFVFIKRLDKEFVDNNIKIDLPYDIRDWPTFEKRISSIHAFLGISKQFQQLNKNNKILNRLINLLTDHIMKNYFKDKLIDQGISMLAPYSIIYTTRLHGVILGILLDKKIVAYDNSTGKLSDFINSWLLEDKSVYMAK